MGDAHGFKRWSRRLPAERPVDVRINDFGEFVEPFSPGDLNAQAGRCMDCGVPFCHQGCPLGNRIPDFNDLVYRQEWRAAWDVLRATNNFPEFTGRLCPAPCEASCVLAANDDAVTIEAIEKAIAERAFAEGWVEPVVVERTGKRVVVVGSGPAGLAAADQLNRAGHHVTVLEAADQVGGLLRYGIPDFKLDKAVLDRRIAVLEAGGVVFRTGVHVGRDEPWEALLDWDAVILALGARRPRDLVVPGRELPGVHFAMDYLEAANRAHRDSPISARGQARGRARRRRHRVGLRGDRQPPRRGQRHPDRAVPCPAPDPRRRQPVARLAAGLSHQLQPSRGRGAGLRLLHRAPDG